MRRFNLVIVFLLIFILFSSSQIFAQGFSYTNSKINFLNILSLKNANPFLINQGAGYAISSVASDSSKKSCSGIEKKEVFDFNKASSFEEEIKKNQPVIYPTLEETNVMRIENEIKQNKKEMSKLIPTNKILPNVINQREIKKEKISEMLNEDSKFKDIYNYGKELGYVESNNSMEINYDNDEKVIIISVSNKSHLNVTNGELTFLVNINNKNNFTKSFFMGIKDENETRMITLFDQEGGIIFDLSNFSTISSWGHHSCAYWDCSDQSSNCDVEIGDSFIVRNDSHDNVIFLDESGDLCLTGNLYENSDYV